MPLSPFSIIIPPGSLYLLLVPPSNGSHRLEILKLFTGLSSLTSPCPDLTISSIPLKPILSPPIPRASFMDKWSVQLHRETVTERLHLEAWPALQVYCSADRAILNFLIFEPVFYKWNPRENGACMRGMKGERFLVAWLLPWTTNLITLQPWRSAGCRNGEDQGLGGAEGRGLYHSIHT